MISFDMLLNNSSSYIRIHQIFLLLLFIVTLFSCVSSANDLPAEVVRDTDSAESSPRIASPAEQDEPVESSRIDPVQSVMDSMTLEQQIGQHFISWMLGVSLRDDLKAVVEAGLLGGVIQYSWNGETTDDIRKNSADLQSAAAQSSHGTSLFLCANQEGGRVRVFKYDDIAQLPPAMAFQRYQDSKAAYSAGYLTGVEMGYLGLNMNLAPVLDLFDKWNDTVIGDRSYGNDEVLTAELGSAFVSGLLDSGIIPVGKHFPGHGLSVTDSHKSLPVVESLSAAELERHILPFRAAVDAGLPVVMTAHLLFPEIDPDYPVTLSKTFLDQYLREQLGFRGLVMSDDFAMEAIAGEYSMETAYREAINAGVDLILIQGRQAVEENIALVKRLLEEGEIDQNIFIQSTYRILSLKHQRGLLKNIDE